MTRQEDATVGRDDHQEDDPPSSSSLPSYRAVLVVDAGRFSDTASAQQPRLSAAIVQVLETTFARAGLADAWSDRRFREQSHRGDGYVVGLRPETLPMLLHPFLRELQEELKRRDRRRLASEPRLRLRASIHLGPLPDHGGWTDGVGKAMVDVHRLLDSDEARTALSEAHPDVTFLVVMVSRRVFEDVVLGGYTELHESQFTEVVAQAKRFAERAYLHVPQPSTGGRAAPVAASAPPGRPDDLTSSPGPARGHDAHVEGGGVVIQSDTVHNSGRVVGRDASGES